MALNEENNNRARNRLLELLRERHAIALTGSGLSSWAGYPSWKALLDNLVGYIVEHGEGTAEAAAYAQSILQTNHNPLVLASKLGAMLAPFDFSQFINEQLGPKPRRFHEVITLSAGLPFRHFVTLNLDPTLHDALIQLEKAFESFTFYETGSAIKFLKSMNLGEVKYPQQLIHFHGRHSDPLEQIALTSEGYGRLYDQMFFQSFLQTMALTQRVVFIGFGFHDQNFLEPFRQAALRTRGTYEFCHFAIVPIADAEDDTEQRARYRNEWCVEPLFFAKQPSTDGNGGFSNFREELLRISAELGLGTPVAAAPTQEMTEAATPSNDPTDAQRVKAVTAAALEEISGDSGV